MLWRFSWRSVGSGRWQVLPSETPSATWGALKAGWVVLVSSGTSKRGNPTSLLLGDQGQAGRALRVTMGCCKDSWKSSGSGLGWSLGIYGSVVSGHWRQSLRSSVSSLLKLLGKGCRVWWVARWVFKLRRDFWANTLNLVIAFVSVRMYLLPWNQLSVQVS